MTFDTVFFDCDSTLISIESLDELGKMMGVGDEVRKLTQLSMDGAALTEDVFKKKMDLIAPSSADVAAIAELCTRMLVPGAREVVEELHKAGKRVFLVSSNFHAIVDSVAGVLGIPENRIVANDIYFSGDGKYAGINEASPLCRQNGKGEVVQQFLREGEKSAFVGDGMVDASTQGIVDLFVGFGGVVVREKVREKADVYISEQHLFSVLSLLLGDTS